MAAFTYRLEHEDGTPADPPTFTPSYRRGVPETRSRSAQAGRFGWSRFETRQINLQRSWLKTVPNGH
jgi:hypothetical protein